MTAAAILEELRALGSPSIKKVLLNHGAREPFYGVKTDELQKIRKRIKTDYALALELYDSGISDAMYLAGLIADDSRMTEADLQRWVDNAYWSLLSESTVPWVAAGSPHGWKMALHWIDSDVETTACAGWCALSSILSVTPDDLLDFEALRSLLARVRDTIHAQPNRVRYCMNGFVIAAGTFAAPLTDFALECAKAIGKVEVYMGATACRVSYAPDSIAAADAKGAIGKKRKTAKC